MIVRVKSMSDADKAYEAAQRLIAESMVRRNGALSFNTNETRSLTKLPPEVAGLAELKTLFLHNTRIRDLSPLTSMNRLQTINLDSTPITSIGLSQIAGLPSLNALELNHSQVEDLRPLLTNPPFGFGEKFGNFPSSSWQIQTLSFIGIPALDLDPKLAELSEIKDSIVRTKKTLSYLREVGEDWPPLPAKVTPIAAQSGKGFQYAPTSNGPIGYNNPASKIEPTSQLAQLHTLLQGELETFLQSSPDGGEFHLRLVNKITAYQRNLGGSVEDLVPIMVWKSGNDLRIELREASGQQAPTINTPPLDVDRRTSLDSILTLHNAFVSLHPEIAELDVVGLDPADRHVSEMTKEVLSDALTAINAQVVLLMDDVRRDLQDLHSEALSDGKAAIRALNLEDESLQNLIKAIVAEAVIERQGGGILSKIGGDVRSAVVGGAVGATANALGPEVAANYSQLVTALEPYMGQLLTAWHGPDSNIKSTIDWVMLHLRINPQSDDEAQNVE